MQVVYTNMVTLWQLKKILPSHLNNPLLILYYIASWKRIIPYIYKDFVVLDDRIRIVVLRGVEETPIKLLGVKINNFFVSNQQESRSLFC